MEMVIFPLERKKIKVLLDRQKAHNVVVDPSKLPETINTAKAIDEMELNAYGNLDFFFFLQET